MLRFRLHFKSLTSKLPTYLSFIGAFCGCDSVHVSSKCKPYQSEVCIDYVCFTHKQIFYKLEK